MKRIAVVCFLLISTLRVFPQTTFTLSGKISNANGASATLSYTDARGSAVNDSCTLNNGKFNFKGDINGGLLVTLSIYKTRAEKGRNALNFFLEPGKITVSGGYSKPNELVISGSKSQLEYQSLRAKTDEFNRSYAAFSNNFSKVYSAYERAKKENLPDDKLDSIYRILKPLQQQREAYVTEYEKINRNFIATPMDSYVGLFAMSTYVPIWPIDTVKMLYNNFSPAVQYSFYGRQIQAQISAIDSKSANTIAPDFVATELNGKKISLADFKGKYVLLDFWASWCLPCRESNPHLIELYKKYNKAGFDVIAVAEDDDAIYNWKKAIQKDGTALWHNVLSGRENKQSSPNSITYKFSIGGLPTKILVDKNGTIIGRYMENDEKALDEKLAALFGG